MNEAQFSLRIPREFREAASAVEPELRAKELERREKFNGMSVQHSAAEFATHDGRTRCKDIARQLRV
ncbi:MAG TPA: hypothetical protein VK846_15780 [Candidatus Limnocylindria bacterium]|nr:hypothetical protein [Candidatus Limnocylindria bacterium]